MTSKKTPAVRSGKAKTKKPTEGISLTASAKKTIGRYDASAFGDPFKAALSSIYKSKRKQITLRLHEDVIQWFKAQGPKYQSYMAAVLRVEMMTVLEMEKKEKKK